MQLLKAAPEDIPAAKRLWTVVFDDGTKGFCHFIFSVCETERIYIVKENGQLVSMLMAIADLQYKQQKGFYLYSACTAPDSRGKGYMKRLVDFALKCEQERGNSFCVLKPASRQLFGFYAQLGFDTVIKTRRSSVEIKKNIWQSADFDTVTSGRFKSCREKFFGGDMVHYTPKSYEKYAQYLYTFGGSTAESEHAFAVYYKEGEHLEVKELFARSSLDGMKLLQAIREREGCESAVISLADGSDLFLGEGRPQDTYAVKGLPRDAYIGLMFE